MECDIDAEWPIVHDQRELCATSTQEPGGFQRKHGFLITRLLYASSPSFHSSHVVEAMVARKSVVHGFRLSGKELHALLG